jgi:RNA polymerase-binding transcription factor DksA
MVSSKTNGATCSTAVVDVPWGIKVVGEEKEYIFPREIDSNRTHYLPDELNVFSEIIADKLVKARKDFQMYKGYLTNSDSNGDGDTAPTFKVLEEGAATLSKEEAGKLAQRQEKFIKYLESALVRIGNKTYGICRESQKLIDPRRLAAVPHATLSADAKNSQK